jgi:hypothetical protein
MASELAWRMQEDGYLMRINDLEADNRKLFSLLKHESEQAEKLRELVRDMWDFFCVVPDDPRTCKEELDFSIEVWRRMRELGVDDG